MESDFGFGLFDDFPENELHPLLIEDFEEKNKKAALQRLIDSNKNIYAPVKYGTVLHQAIQEGDNIQVDSLIGTYQSDFEKIQNYLVSKYKWIASEKIWLKKIVLVAVGEDQCRSAKDMEIYPSSRADLRRAILVLLNNPVNGEDVAVIHPNENNSLSVCQLIRNLIPNGFLSWNYTNSEGKCETFIEVAASKGRVDVIERLYNLGAELAIPEHNPLIAACRSLQKDTIHWLLTEHFDNFDCTKRDSNHNNALMVLMQRQRKQFDFVLEKMIAYRQKYYDESESQAFNSIFRSVNDDTTILSILQYIGKGPMRKKIEQYIVRYQLDLSYQWNSVSILACLISFQIALEYCFDGIRSHPELLGLVQYDNTILDALLRRGHTDFLKEMYTQHPEVKKYFETVRGLDRLHEALTEHQIEQIKFIREHHLEFLMEDVEKLKRDVFCCSYYLPDYYEKHAALMIEYFPEFKCAVEEAWKLAVVCQSNSDLVSFSKLGIQLNDSSVDITGLQQPLHSIRGSKGETLLHLAVEKDNDKMVNQLLEAGCDLDVLDNDGNHPVHFVKSVDMLNLLIDRHPEGRDLVNRTNSAGYSVLHTVCSLHIPIDPLIALLEKVIDCGADVNQLTNDGESAAFIVGNCTALNVLREHDINLDVVNCNDETALQRHLKNGNNSMNNALFPLTHESPTFKEHAHKYLFMLTNSYPGFLKCDYEQFLEKYPETTKLLFDSLYKHSREQASRLFSNACCNALNLIVEKFLDFDYDLDYNCVDQFDCTPIIGLFSYMEQNNFHIVKRLLEKGVDLDLRSHWGRNALLTIVWNFRSARSYGHDGDTIQLLLNHGAQVNSTDHDGNTPLHLAIENREWELVEVLVRNGGNLKARNKNGRMPFQMGSIVERELYDFMC